MGGRAGFPKLANIKIVRNYAAAGGAGGNLERGSRDALAGSDNQAAGDLRCLRARSEKNCIARRDLLIYAYNNRVIDLRATGIACVVANENILSAECVQYAGAASNESVECAGAVKKSGL